MRKKHLFILLILCGLLFIAAGLKAFKLFPFQEKIVLTNEELPANVKQQLGKELKALPNTPKTFEDFIIRGDLFTDKKFYALAINEYVQASKINAGSPDPYIKIGKIHLKNQNPDNAEQAFLKALTLDKENLDAKLNLGKTYLLQKNAPKAKEIFEQIQVKNQLVRYYQGITRAFFGDYDNSKKALQEAVEIGTNTEIVDKAKIFLAAYDEFSKTSGGQKIHIKTLLARSFNQVEEYDISIQLLFQVVQEKKEYRDAWILLGYAYLQTEKYDDALQALLTARKLDPGKSETLFFLGLTYFAQNNLDEAVKYFESSLQAGYEPRIQALQKVAEVYFQQGDFDHAAKKYDEVLKTNTDDINYFVRPIWIYIDKLQDATKALDLAQKAVTTHPSEAMSYNLLGWSQIANGSYTDAQTNLEKALQIDPKLDAAYLNMGWLQENLKNYESAKTYYQKAYELAKGTSVGDLAQKRYNDLMSESTSSSTPSTTNPFIQ